jgi:hydrogenase large subunit
MATKIAPNERVGDQQANIVDMSWDPISRIVGNLGIYTKVDFTNRR